VRLFRKSEEKIARQAAAQTEIDRLKSLSAEQLAVLVLPGMDPETVGRGVSLRPQQLCEYLLRDFPGIGQSKPLLLMAPTRRALERLEAAGLVSWSSALGRSPLWCITSLGESALAEGTAEQRLAAPSQSAAG
jgi:hypothetical protein